jgi:hypothetical protein
MVIDITPITALDEKSYNPIMRAELSFSTPNFLSEGFLKCVGKALPKRIPDEFRTLARSAGTKNTATNSGTGSVPWLGFHRSRDGARTPLHQEAHAGALPLSTTFSGVIRSDELLRLMQNPWCVLGWLWPNVSLSAARWVILTPSIHDGGANCVH